MTTPRDAAIEAALAGGRILRHGIGQVRQIRHKGEVDLVTEIDVASEEAVVGVIRRHFPQHRILAEEGSVGGDDPRARWIIDPLDGTTNYAHGFPFFCVSVGYEEDGEMVAGAIYDPVLDELFLAERGRGATVNGRPMAVSAVERVGQALLTTGFPYDRTRLPRALRQFERMSHRSRAVRRMGSAALDLAYVAAGRLDGYWEASINAWDVAAGLVLVLEAGGRVSGLRGEPFAVDGGDVLASNGRLHGEMLELLTSALE
jgi:myo-inositol-1(or 4)-monophosphatase